MSTPWLRDPIGSLTACELGDTLFTRSSGALFLPPSEGAKREGPPYLFRPSDGGKHLFTYPMAKASQLARLAKKQKLVKKYATKRAALKLAGDSEGLQKLPRNSSPVRLKNRCAVTGRSRGYMRTFGLSRIQFREMARDGKIPGVKKASW